jgi:Domain of unknown function (DUF3303)
MLHIAVLTHGPDTCAAGHPAIGELARTGFGKMEESAGKLGIKAQGFWVDAPGHTFFMLLDAPHAHAVNQLMIETQAFLWNTVEIHPVITSEEAMPLTAKA